VAAFFVLAFAGWASGLSPGACGLRALEAAAVFYFVTRIAGGITARLLAGAAVEDMRRRQAAGKETGDYGN